MKAHPSAIIDPEARIADDVEIGPFCIVGAGVRIGPGCRLGPHVMLQGPVVVGRNNVFHPQSKVGSAGCGPIEIGDDNMFREYSHVDGPKPGSQTRIGSGNRFGVCAAVGPGCTLGNGIRLGAYALIGEACVLEDEAQIEAQVVLEDERKVGRMSRVRSLVPVTEDVPPFMIMDGNPAQGEPRSWEAGPVIEGGAP
jgi:UDP-N-acetylglucosamine acyltransferase